MVHREGFEERLPAVRVVLRCVCCTKLCTGRVKESGHKLPCDLHTIHRQRTPPHTHTHQHPARATHTSTHTRLNTTQTATDTQKNTVYVVAKRMSKRCSIEQYAIALAQHFVHTYPRVSWL